MTYRFALIALAAAFLAVCLFAFPAVVLSKLAAAVVRFIKSEE